MSKDRIYSTHQQEVSAFEFDHRVADVFSDMIQRSVPGYRSLIAMMGVIAEAYAKPGTRIYDLGSSLGASSLAVLNRVSGMQLELVAVDNSTAMMERFEHNIRESLGQVELTTHCKDLLEVEVNQASMVMLNYTLQFVPLDERDALLQRISKGMEPSGALVLSEKIMSEDPEEQAFLTDLHLQFKRSNGYSDLEISQKRTALENVLVPETIAVHEQRLRDAGFSHVQKWFQAINFVSWLAVK